MSQPMSGSQSSLSVNGVSPASASASSHEWYVLTGGFGYGGVVYGPLPMDQLVQLADAGRISMLDYVKDGPNSPWITIHALQHYALKDLSITLMNPGANSNQGAPIAPISAMPLTGLPNAPVFYGAPPIFWGTEVPAVVPSLTPLVPKRETDLAPASDRPPNGSEAAYKPAIQRRPEADVPAAAASPSSVVPKQEPKSVPAVDRPTSASDATPRPAFQPAPPRPPMPAKPPQPVFAAKAISKPRPVPREPLIDFSNLDLFSGSKPTIYAVTLIAASLLAVAVIFLAPGRKGPLVVLYKELAALHQEIEKRASSMKNTKELNEFTKPILVESTKIRQNLQSSTHPAKSDLTAAVASMKAALGARKTAEAKAELNVAADKLNSAKKLLHL